MFDGLEYRSIPCWHADFPTEFKSNSTDKPGRNVRRHYPTMSMAECRNFALGVERYVAPQAVLFYWITGALLVKGEHVPIMRNMGFEPTAMGFVWIKLNPNSSPHFFTVRDIFSGGGFTTRKNAEFCIIGKRGRMANAIRTVTRAAASHDGVEIDVEVEVAEVHPDGGREAHERPRQAVIQRSLRASSTTKDTATRTRLSTMAAPGSVSRVM